MSAEIKLSILRDGRSQVWREASLCNKQCTSGASTKKDDSPEFPYPLHSTVSLLSFAILSLELTLSSCFAPWPPLLTHCASSQHLAIQVSDSAHAQPYRNPSRCSVVDPMPQLSFHFAQCHNEHIHRPYQGSRASGSFSSLPPHPKPKSLFEDARARGQRLDKRYPKFGRGLKTVHRASQAILLYLWCTDEATRPTVIVGVLCFAFAEVGLLYIFYVRHQARQGQEKQSSRSIVSSPTSGLDSAVHCPRCGHHARSVEVPQESNIVRS